LPLDEATMERLRPEVLPDAAAVARGWTSVVDQGGSFRFPDSGLTDLAGAARARLILSAADLPGRVEALRSGAGLVLEALAVGGHGAECRPALERLAAGFPARLTDGAPAAADLVFGVAVAAELVGDPDLTDRLLAPATPLTHLVDRSRDADAATLARLGLARLADLAGQHQASARLRAEAGSPSIPGREPSLDAVVTLAERAAPAGRWNADADADADAGPGLVDDDRTAARFLLAARRLLLPEPSAGGYGPSACMVELLPIFPTAWLGGEVEVHRAPVAGVRVSFAIRWHGYRPALLWEIEGSTSTDPTAIGPGGRPLVLTCPGLDPAWSSDQATGETLLAGSAVELPDAPGPGDSFN
jgi:hypothetical protein